MRHTLVDASVVDAAKLVELIPHMVDVVCGTGLELVVRLVVRLGCV